MAVQDSTETAPTGEGEGTEGSDKPPHGDSSSHRLSVKNLTAHNKAANAHNAARPSVAAPQKASFLPEKKPTTGQTNGIQKVDSVSAHHSIPMPPPDAFSHDKQPGLTRETLKQLQMHQKRESNSTPSSTSPTTLSPTVSESEGWSVPSSRAPSRPGSRAPSFSGGKSDVKVDAISSPTPTAKKGSTKPATAPVSKTPSRAASVASDGAEKKSLSLKEFLSGAGPKLARRSSQRSNASSRKSDSDARSIGESTASLLKKYGVCERVAIGKGATSVVRLAHKWDRSEEKLYAVKEFRKRRKNETEKEYVKKLTAEFCISSTLHHVNIVETVDLVQDENQRWCEVMEFCPGGDLYAAIKRGGMSPSEVECCFKQILTGVAYLHSQGVAHRDIKPENLFFDTKGHLKIGDYGASTVYRLPWETSIHMSTGLCGSEPYIAPEQFLGKPYDARLVDIWACGIVYYCLHFQELPWPSAQMSNPLYAAYAAACGSPKPEQSACPPTINNLSPRACRPVIRKMLEPDPKLRSCIEDIIAHPWLQSIEVCHTMAKPTHLHVYAQQQAQAQVQPLG